MQEVIKYQKRNKVVNLLMIFFCLAIISCSTDGIDGIAPTKVNEKINLTITGDISKSIDIESEELISYGISSNPYINYGEYEVIIDLKDNSYLKLLVYNKYETIPFDSEISYPAYSHDLIKSRTAYVIADYFINNQKEYSSVSTLVSNIEQTNVLETQENESFLKLFLEDVTLFNLNKEGHSAEVVEINFTGTLSFNK